MRRQLQDQYLVQHMVLKPALNDLLHCVGGLAEERAPAVAAG